jgi:D-serine deaminase-like pyridoxal phosphate-dependent protein
VQVGDRVQIIPNHICPVVNLYDRIYLVSGEDVLQEIKIDCRGKLQ